MKKKTKILVPIDFSICAENALNYALLLADRMDATLEVLNVTPYEALPVDYPTFVASITEERILRSKELMKNKIDKIKRDVAPLLGFEPSIETNIEIGVPDAKIVEVASRDQVDFIIMGTQGQNSILDRFLGSTAVEVIKHSPCPVFVIPKQARFNEDMLIGYATDFKDADAFEIWKITKMLQPFQADITAVHLSENGELVKDKIEEFKGFFKDNAPYVDIRFYSFQSKDMIADLNTFIQNHSINLMVVYKPKRNFFERLFHSSFTKKMVRHTEVPLLILNEK